MVEGLITLLLFSWFLLEWPQLMDRVEALQEDEPDFLSAEIRLARWKAGDTYMAEKQEVGVDDDG